jgi:hypothetical protein
LLGAIGQHKGYDVLLACAKDAVKRRLPLEFVVIGYTQKDAPLIKTGRVFVTGNYLEAEAIHLLRRENPHVIFLPSIWPETWSYTLTHALESGIPVAGFDIGAIGERLKSRQLGYVLNLRTTPSELNDQLLNIARLQSKRQGGKVEDTAGELAVDVADGSEHQQQATGGGRAVLYGKGKLTNMKQQKPETVTQTEGIAATVEPLAVSPGLYMFSVRSAAPQTKLGRHGLQLPALNVTVGPGTPQTQVEFVPSLTSNGTWLSKSGDLLVVKVNAPGAILLMNSVRTTSGSALAVRFEKLEDRDERPELPSTTTAPKVQPAAVEEAAPEAEVARLDGLRLQIGTHVRARGDLNFVDKPWAGKIGKGHWIESFSVTPLEALSAQDIEYKGLTSSGFESPWITNGAPCGTRGMSIPLVGFAVRLKTDAVRKDYDCEYSAYCQSGIVVGPLRNGVPCRSTVSNDPIEGLQIRIVKRTQALSGSPSSPEPASRPPAAGPNFGRYRDEEEDAEQTPAKVPKTAAKPATKKTKVAPASNKPVASKTKGRRR